MRINVLIEKFVEYDGGPFKYRANLAGYPDLHSEAPAVTPEGAVRSLLRHEGAFERLNAVRNPSETAGCSTVRITRALKRKFEG